MSDTSLSRIAANMIRRVAVRVTSSRFWEFDGFKGEFDDAPVFSGIGFYSRPEEGSKAAEAIVVKVQGNADHPVIVATHDEDLRRAHAEIRDMDFGEAGMVSRGAFVKVTKDGDVIIRAAAGREVLVDDGSGAQELATKADLDAHITVYNAHTHSYLPGPGSATPTAVPLPLDSTPRPGTQVLKAK
jgi:phage gp45-like